MKQLTIFICLIVTAVAGQAQPCRYCLNAADYLNDIWHPTPGALQMKHRSKGQAIWFGGATYRPYSGQKPTDKLLKKQALFIVHHDSLYINCRHLNCQGIKFGNWYAPAFVFDRDYVLFAAPSIKNRQDATMAGFFFGIAGAATVALSSSDDFCCYIYNPSTGLSELIDESLLRRLIGERFDLQDALDQTELKRRLLPETVLPLLRKAGLLE